MKTKKKKLTISEFARMGGKACLKKHGRAFFVELGKKRWKNTEK